MTPHDHEPRIPEPLERELRSAFGRGPGVSPETDRAILEMALKVGMAHEVRRRTIGVRRVRLMGLGALAAVLAGAVTAWVVWPARPAPQTLAMKSGPAEDLNADGRVDMLDVLILAERRGKGLDFNQDGREDRADADALAADVVKLERGTL
jgi:hypothetical protein